MPKSGGKSLRQLREDAEHYSKFAFDPAGQGWMLEIAGRQDVGNFVVMMLNRYVPIEPLQTIAPVLRKFVRGGTGRLEAAETTLLKDYWRVLDLSGGDLLRWD